MQSEVSRTENGNGFRVIRLQASNVKALKAVDVTPNPDSPLVVIGGNNGQGKTSVLDSIMYALGGKDAVCADPLRHGQKKGQIVVDLGKYTATRKFTPTGQTLELKTKEGLNVPSPQGVLDSLAGVLNFDPLEFSRMAPAKRLATLISLVKLDVDLDELATKRKTIFDKRSKLSQTHRDFLGQLRQTPEPDASLPTAKIDVAGLVAEKNKLEADNNARASLQTQLAGLQVTIEEAYEESNQLIADLEEINRRILANKERIKDLDGQEKNLNAAIAAAPTHDTRSIDAQISDASDLNTKIERAVSYRVRAADLAKMGEEVEQLSEQIEDLDQDKEDALEKAQFPVPGLSFADGDVCYNGTLYDQLSSAEQVRVSLAMAMSMNPQLRVILIKDGSLLDETSLGIIREMAKDRGFQIWIEVVGNRADATLIIEDGAVVGAEEAVEPEVEVVS